MNPIKMICCFSKIYVGMWLSIFKMRVLTTHKLHKTNIMMDTLYNHFAIDRSVRYHNAGGDLRQNVTDVYTRATPRYIDKTNNTSRCVKFQYKCRFTAHGRHTGAISGYILGF